MSIDLDDVAAVDQDQLDPNVAGGWARATQFFLSFDERAEGRRGRMVLATAVFQAVLAPALDRSVGAVRDISGLSGVATDLGSVSFAGFQAFSLFGALATVLLSAMLVGGRLAAFVSESPGHGLRTAARELWMLLSTEWNILRRRPSTDQLFLVGLGAYTVAVTVRDAMRLVRWCSWEGPIKWFGMEHSALAAPISLLYWFENKLELVSLGAALLATVALLRWMREAPATARPAAVRNVRAMGVFQPSFDVQREDQRSAAATLFHGDVVRRGLDSLARWRPTSAISSESELQLQLYRHFREDGFSVGFEEQLGGRNRVDLTLDGSVAIELKYGQLRANERNRVMGQSSVYAGRWSGRGPLLVVCVGAPDERVVEVSLNAGRWNRTLPEHQGQPEDLPAPILVVTQVGDYRNGALGP